VRRLTIAVHVGLVVALVLLLGLRLVGLSVGIAAQAGVIVSMLGVALLLAHSRGRAGRE
jgi:hypothetical protein